ncbi:putative gustatory receptor 28b [Athalia rosae]|uniref:putative gustatory receptor 28b n=1 Tax=Athalia rosae TaxID=37344 RepID=UPI002033BAE8|nr:putative gustatory receptor 28b [Athalia rosae]
MFGQRKTFYDSMKPIVYLNCLVGMGALRQPCQSTIKYFVLCLYMFFINAGNIVFVYYATSWIFNVMDVAHITHRTSRIGAVMMLILNLTNAFHTVLAPILVCLQRKAFLDYFKHLPILDIKFETIFGVDIQNEYRKRFIHLSLKIIIPIILLNGVIVIELLLMTDNIVGFSILNLSILMNIFQPTTVIFTLSFNFYVLLGYLEKKFQDLNIALMKLAVQIDPAKEESESVDIMADKLRRLKEIRNIHMQLYELAKGANAGFGVQNILTVGSSFVIVTGLLYCIYLGVKTELSLTERRVQLAIIPTITWVIIYALRVWILAHSCRRVTERAKETGHVIYELLILNYDDRLQNEIHEFSLQMIQNPVTFDACGFFTIDHAFFHGVIGTVTTHLVILIQMSDSVLDTSCDN